MLAIVALFLGTCCALVHANAARVNLHTVRTLTFYHGARTTGRRDPGVLQLQCVGRECNEVGVPVVQCHNTGVVANDVDAVQWACSASLPSAYKLSRVNVECEGYDSRYDRTYVLAGSCALRFSLHRRRRRHAAPSPTAPRSRTVGNETSTMLVLIDGLLVLLVCCLPLVYCAYLPPPMRRPPMTYAVSV